MRNSFSENMKSMMKSIFSYGVLTKDNRYLDSYRKELTSDEFDKVFDEYSKYLTENFRVVYNTYTDHEGCTYNSLEKI